MEQGVFKIYIDGQAGTAGLKISQQLEEHDDIELVVIDEEKRKDLQARLECIAESDVAILCLPDEDAKEIAAAVDARAAEEGAGSAFEKVRIIDCSTAHRTADGWLYGLPEVYSTNSSKNNISFEGVKNSSGLRNDAHQRYKTAMRVANPGCHPTGYIVSILPLVDAGIIDPDAVLCVHSLTGYSGGGKAMIALYENADNLRAPMQYALAQEHKHLPEMQKYSGVKTAPVFSPIVCDFYSGLMTCVALPPGAMLKALSMEEFREVLASFYKDCPLIKVRELGYEFSEIGDVGSLTSGAVSIKDRAGFLAADAFSNRDDLEILITGKNDRIEVISRYDNLGKGASGAAIQNMNLMLGLPETKGLILDSQGTANEEQRQG